MDKEGIRAEVLEKRNNVDRREVIEKGDIVKEKLFSLKEYKKAKKVMFFVSFGKEIYTHNMIEEALKDKTVIVPRVVDFEIVPCIIKSLGELQPGKYRILEPANPNKINPNEIEVVLVPGIAFDKKGYRLGYGKGYYDIFLKKLGALKVGLCMDFEIIDKIPAREWDIPMDIVISEERILMDLEKG